MQPTYDAEFGKIVRWLVANNLQWREQDGKRFLQKRTDPRPPLLIRQKMENSHAHRNDTRRQPDG